MKKMIILVLPILLYGCQTPTVKSIRDEPIVSDTAVATDIVTIENGQFSPKSIQISPGDTLTIQNPDKAIWTVISDPHPSHNQNPDFYKILYSGESYQYQFSSAGSFGIHLEENPSIGLKVMVE